MISLQQHKRENSIIQDPQLIQDQVFSHMDSANQDKETPAVVVAVAIILTLAEMLTGAVAAQVLL
jgi:hypothetical protein